MKFYALTVRHWWAVPSAVALVVVLCWTVGASDVPVPSLTGGMGSAQLAYFTPVLIVAAVVYCLERRLHQAEGTAVLPVHLFDRGAVVLTVVLMHAAVPAVGLDIARNTTLLLALALIAHRVANEAVAVASGLMFLILNLILGRASNPDGRTAHMWWAVPLHPPGSPAAWLVAVACLVLVLLLPRARDSATR
ncbi:hypothetical protein ACWEFL_25100 [Streptomyces sp. NPDC004838]